MFQQINWSNELQARSIPIINAITSRNSSEVKRLIQKGADVNVRAPGGGKTPLHIAVNGNLEAIVTLLLEAKANVNAVTDRKFTPLHIAAQTGNVTLIQKLLDAGAVIDAPTDVGCTPLHEAAAKGHQEAVVTLVERGANIHFKEYKFQLTPSQLAARVNQYTVALYLENIEKTSSKTKTGATFFAEKPDYLTQAKMAYQQGKYKEAVNLFGRAAEASHDNGQKASIICNIGHSYFALKDYNCAIRSYTDALEVSPGNITAYQWRAKAYKKLADLSESNHDKEALLVKISQDEDKISELGQRQNNQLAM
jgi:tetratricopeptide (TPR) repeat protein